MPSPEPRAGGKKERKGNLAWKKKPKTPPNNSQKSNYLSTTLRGSRGGVGNFSGKNESFGEGKAPSGTMASILVVISPP